MKVIYNNIGIKSVKHLCCVLALSRDQLEFLLKNLNLYYYSFNLPKRDKRKNIKVKDGVQQFRTITPSIEGLREIQTKINLRILSQIQLPVYITGVIKGLDNIKNAKAHKGLKYHFKTDLKNYFPSITYDRVFNMFKSHGFSDKVSKILASLTTYDNQVPQGAPTSSSIANLVFLKYDKPLIDFCIQNNIVYTRFIDDLVFSSSTAFQKKTSTLVDLILKSGFTISHKKTFYSAGYIVLERKLITYSISITCK
ncbi:MAG: reverse transcriptase family protein [Segetibacter sp.]